MPSWSESFLRPFSIAVQIAGDSWTGKAPIGAKRSGSWRRVRDEHLKFYPQCQCCGGTDRLRVHHKVPFHEAPDLELDPSNLMTLCESKKFGLNCHFLFGHLGNWRKSNPWVQIDVAVMKRKLSGRFKELSLWLHTFLTVNADV